MAHQEILHFSTRGRGTQNISDAVAKVVSASSVQCGLAHVFVQHTSCSLTITENADADVRRDLETGPLRLIGCRRALGRARGSDMQKYGFQGL